jgi:peptide/nickel transport system ATP-binding protein
MADLKPAEPTAAVAVADLSVVFRNRRRSMMAVKALSMRVAEGETFGIVGESGSGKSTVLRAIAGLTEACSGTITVFGRAMAMRRTKQERRQLQLVFQDPYGSLHPHQTIDHILSEPLAIHHMADVDLRVANALSEVGLSEQHRFRYPHQLSGGQRQRVAIARALILGPRLLLLDEPTSALDVSIQAEILNLLVMLRKNHGLTAILVSHDLSVVAHLCNRFAIMREGQLVEVLDVEDLRRDNARHAYTRELLEASRGYRRLPLQR